MVSENSDEGERNRTIAQAFWDLPREYRKDSSGNYATIERSVKGKTGIKLNARTICRIGAEWDARNCVQHKVVGASAEQLVPQRDHQLERQLVEKYGLRFAVVVNSSAPLERLANLPLEADDALHRTLGLMGGHVLGPILRPGDILGVGSGRGPGRTAQSLYDNSWLSRSFPNLKVIVSLTGPMRISDWSGEEMKTRDANDIAHELRLCLRPDMDEKRVEHAVPANNRHVKNARLGFTWRRFRPNVVLIGVGALAGGHRLKYPSRIGELSKLSSTITRIVATAETWDNHFRSADGGPEYHCVGDVCNFLFPVPPPGGTLTDLPEELVEDISRFNDNIASVSISQLAEVRGNGSVLAIAGGLRYKGYAIRHVLRHRPGFVTHLVTDDQCARWLCGPVETGRDPRIEKARKAIRKRKPTRRGSRTV